MGADNLESQVMNNFFGSENKSNLFGKKKSDGMPTYEQQTAGQNLAIPKLDRTATTIKAPLTKTADINTDAYLKKKRQADIFNKLGGLAEGAKSIFSIKAPQAAPEMDDDKKILGMAPTTFWLVLTGLVLTTATIVILKNGKSVKTT